ncbi:MAG: hypothetical protein AAF985_00905 [Bacteroidota bacterium]
MHLRIFLSLILFCSLPFTVYTQSSTFYEKAFNEIKAILDGIQPLDFKKAVYLTENAYLDGNINYDHYQERIEGLQQLVQKLITSNELNYPYPDKDEVEKYAALFSVLTSEIPVIMGKDTLYHMPYNYDFDDVFGDKDWTSMFVTKLLDIEKGNCHSLPYLYKILADEIGASAHLALAPNHVYIKHKCEKAGWYNTELTSASFPIDAWLMASGYIHLDAIRSGIYMRDLSDQEAVAMCMVDLAMGHSKKFSDQNFSFLIKCCDLALQYFPDYINALLFKAEIRQRQTKLLMEEHNVEYPKDLFRLVPSAKQLWSEMEELYVSIHRLGYRQMPKQMYIDWLVSLKEEKDKYSNRKVTRFK